MRDPFPLPGFQRTAERQRLGHSLVTCLFTRALQQAPSHLADCAPPRSTTTAAGGDRLTDRRQRWGETRQGAGPRPVVIEEKCSRAPGPIIVRTLMSLRRFLCGKKAWMVTTTIYNHRLQPLRVCNGGAKVKFAGGGEQTAPCWVRHQPQRDGSYLCDSALCSREAWETAPGEDSVGTHWFQPGSFLCRGGCCHVLAGSRRGEGWGALSAGLPCPRLGFAGKQLHRVSL